MATTLAKWAYNVYSPAGYVLIDLATTPDREHELIQPYHLMFNECTNSWMYKTDFPAALHSSIDKLTVGMFIAVIEPVEVAADKQLAASYESRDLYLRDFEDCPACPECGHKFVSHWNGGCDAPFKIAGTCLNRNSGDDGDHEIITCPYCKTVYEVTLHVTRTTHFTCSKV